MMDFVRIKFDFLVILMFGSFLVVWTDQVQAKRVKIHVPVKVKHHHHTHTVVKHVHHQIPVHVAPDHEEVHIFNPGSQEQILDSGEAWLSRKSRPTRQHHQHHDYTDFGDSQRERELEYSNFDKVLRKKQRTKKKNRQIFSNSNIGWSGRNDYDKIANEYLESLRRQKIPPPDTIDFDFPAYTDDDE